MNTPEDDAEFKRLAGEWFFAEYGSWSANVGGQKPNAADSPEGREYLALTPAQLFEKWRARIEGDVEMAAKWR